MTRARVNWSALDPATRRKVKARAVELPSPPAPPAPRASERLGRDTASYRCHVCDAVITGWTRADAHVMAHGGGRVSIVLTNTTGATVPRDQGDRP